MTGPFVRSLPQPELSMSSVCGWSEPSLAELPMDSWMSHLPGALWDIPLSHLAIPGRLLPGDKVVFPKAINREKNHAGKCCDIAAAKTNVR